MAQPFRVCLPLPVLDRVQHQLARRRDDCASFTEQSERAADQQHGDKCHSEQRPGQMTEEHLIGGAAESFDTNGLRFQKLSSDFFRALLDLGAGDLKATAAGEHWRGRRAVGVAG